MFDLGPAASVSIGEFSLLNGSRIICRSSIKIGAYCLVSWNTVLMDSRGVPRDAQIRRAWLQAAARSPNRHLEDNAPGAPIVLGNGVWLGFDSCVLPGVTIGDGAIVGARSVVVESVPAYSIVVGNPARLVRQLDPEESKRSMADAMARSHSDFVVTPA
jgi:acetyltransferase-like isoleucine patch superfamily enzyme